MPHTVTTQHASARKLAAVHAVMPLRDVPARFGALLGMVYSKARESGLALDGQNVFLYRDRSDGNADVDFGVGVSAAFAPLGEITFTETPSGNVATTTHWGDYRELGIAHAAIMEWSRINNRSLAGPRWEVYGHWSDDPAKQCVDVYYLLAS